MEDHANLSCAASTTIGGLIGESVPMRALHELIERVSQTTSTVLLQGETGTGKELVARRIHLKGPLREKAFVPIDCSALTTTLVESELFGHVRGAFTGADRAKVGLLKAADEGTIFLDEIGELPIPLQAKLLRALQEKEIRPVGSVGRTPINVRVIAATNRDLESAVRKGEFRQDLYFRLKVVQINLPPLRERRGDIPLLVDHFLQKFSDPSRRVYSISGGALRRLIIYDWPGNVRELQNAIESAVVLSSNKSLGASDFKAILGGTLVDDIGDTNELVPLSEIKRRAIMHALRETGGDKIDAARLLGIGKTTLYRKLKEYLRK